MILVAAAWHCALLSSSRFAHTAVVECNYSNSNPANMSVYPKF